jgi:hypothetical protein
MKYAVLALAMVLGSAASAFTVEPCASESGPTIGINELVTPINNNSRSYYNNTVHTYKVDYLEPACCSYGVAIVLPDVQSEIGDSKCVAITGLSGVDVKNARSSYDSVRGLLLTFKTRVYNGSGTDPGPDLKVRVNLTTSSVNIE